MSRHPLHDHPSRPGRSPFASLRAFAAAGLGLGFAAPGLASDPVPAAVAEARPAGFADVVLARSVLAALDAEPDLRGVNLVVSVVDRVALIGGPVPTAAAARRAEEVVRKVPGVRDVKNTCFVSIGPDPLLKAVASRLGSALPARPVMGGLPGVLTPHPTPPWPAPPATQVAAGPNGTTTTALKPALPLADALSVLGSPVGPAGPARSETSERPKRGAQGEPKSAVPAPVVLTGTVPPPPAVAAKPGDVLTAAGEVKKADARFARLTVEMREGVLVVGGAAPRAADAWDFADKLRKIPGVSRVAVGDVVGK